jgi:hypothetical protein
MPQSVCVTAAAAATAVLPEHPPGLQPLQSSNMPTCSRARLVYLRQVKLMRWHTTAHAKVMAHIGRDRIQMFPPQGWTQCGTSGTTVSTRLALLQKVTGRAGEKEGRLWPGDECTKVADQGQRTPLTSICPLVYVFNCLCFSPAATLWCWLRLVCQRHWHVASKRNTCAMLHE